MLNHVVFCRKLSQLFSILFRFYLHLHFMKLSKRFLFAIPLLLLAIWAFSAHFPYCTPFTHSVGDKVDSLNGVYVFYNGTVSNVSGRNTTSDGYNLGLKYQCVEFVKRYYYEYLNHKMPDSYGHAKDFFDSKLADGKLSTRRNLLQFQNRGTSKPKVNDLLVFDGTRFNPYGHVAIISRVTDREVEIIQQNPGPFASSRATYRLIQTDNLWEIKESTVLGWLRKK
jgi:surface antigen